jgi:hypothetical protein
MSISFPVKQILKFKVPGVFALAILAGQLALTGLPSNDHPLCTINVERPHASTYTKERKNLDVLKLNITTECEVAQKYTILNAEIQAIVENTQITAHRFNAELRTSVGNGRKKARFRDLQVNCNSLESTMYLGKAWGEVHLANGKIEKVSGDSEYFISEYCKIDAR